MKEPEEGRGGGGGREGRKRRIWILALVLVISATSNAWEVRLFQRNLSGKT